MGLSPEEEDAFAAIASVLAASRRPRLPWGVLAVSIGVVGVAVVGALLLGVPGRLAGLFSLTFVMALVAGLLLIARSDRHANRF